MSLGFYDGSQDDSNDSLVDFPNNGWGLGDVDGLVLGKFESLYNKRLDG